MASFGNITTFLTHIHANLDILLYEIISIVKKELS